MSGARSSRPLLAAATILSLAAGAILSGWRGPYLSHASTTEDAPPSSGDWASASRPNEEIPVVVTQESADLPEGCTPEAAAQLFVDFFDAFNRGDQEQLSSYIGSDFEFFAEQFQQGGPENFVAYSRTAAVSLAFPQGPPPGTRLAEPAELLAYFAERHAQDERLNLLSIHIGSSWHPGGSLGALVERTADDLQESSGSDIDSGFSLAGAVLSGRGAINCSEGTITAWSMSPGEPGREWPPICPALETPPLGRIIVACASE